ncbi:MAG: hypothetical protein O2797_05130 [Bacteroidetes bacterium]|nr:hypothetical protein [Bacteroidota bacterium]MDA1333582.1 hypothetical protein [Bacteroidota bacterium]
MSNQIANSLLEDILNQVAQELNDTLPSIRTRLLDAGRETLSDQSHLLAHWMSLASAGSLSREDVGWLAKGNMDLGRLTALEQSGLALADVDRLRQAITSSVISSIGKAILS